VGVFSSISFTSNMYADQDDDAKRGDFSRVFPSWGQNRFWLSSSPRFFSANVVVFCYLLLLRYIILTLLFISKALTLMKCGFTC
jgi:hypothetical protein